VKRDKLSLILPLAALLVAVMSSDSRALEPEVAPVVLDATPHNDATDKRGGGFLRVTFSPDGDARGDRVRIRVRSTPSDRLRRRRRGLHRRPRRSRARPRDGEGPRRRTSTERLRARRRQIERHLIAYTFRGGPAGAGRVVVIAR
jgi:hypothetical protein